MQGYTRLHGPTVGLQLLVLRTAKLCITAIVLAILATSSYKAAKVYRNSPYSTLSHGMYARKIITDQRVELSRDLVYFNDETVMDRLGCATADRTQVHLNYTCFYHDPGRAAAFPADTILLDTASMCTAIYKPQPADYGRPWCVRQVKTQHVTDSIPKSDRLHLPGTTLLTGMLSGPNPTHQLNIHFYHIYLMMKRNNIPMGKLNIVIDCYEAKEHIGTYGLGLAEAFGPVRLLHQLPKMTTFEQVKWSLPAGFPFDIHYYEVDKTLDCNMVGLAWAVKLHYGIDPNQVADPQKVVIAQRKQTESRRLADANELVAALEMKGYDVSLVTFGDLTFKQQLEAVQDASVLVGVTGSDLVNSVFLPLVATIVEIFPTAHGVQVFTPELWHLAQMSGKYHMKYVSPYNSTLLYDAEGHVWGDRPVHQVNITQVHVPSLAALVESAVVTSAWTTRMRSSIKPEKRGRMVSCVVQDKDWFSGLARDWE